MTQHNSPGGQQQGQELVGSPGGTQGGAQGGTQGGAEVHPHDGTGEPVSGQLVTGQPVTGQPVSGQPVTGEPVAGESDQAPRSGTQKLSKQKLSTQKRRNQKLLTQRFLTGASLLVLALALAAAAWPGLFTATDPLATAPASTLLPPSAHHWLGTDQVGRDVYARIIYAVRPALLVGIGATLIAGVVGSLLGTGLGLAPKAVDAGGSRVLDTILAMPEFLLALLCVAVIGPGTLGVFAALTVAAVPSYARLARSATLSARSSDHVRAARILGLSPARVFVMHLLPVTAKPVVALAAVGTATVMLSAAGLSFLGLGAQPPAPDWGVMLAESRNFASRAWWLVVFPGVSLALTVGAITVLGRMLRERLR